MINISVVIPAYNEAPRIERAIRSVLKQYHQVNEIIVVDDGSTDETAEIVSKYDYCLTIIRQANQGPSEARNTGIRNAKQEWIAFLDADDEWLPVHIDNAYKLLHQHPEIVWYCAAFKIYTEEGNLIAHVHPKDKFIHNGIIDNYFLTQAELSFSLPSSMIVKKSVFDEIGMFNNKLRRGEDLDMWFRIALKYSKIAYSIFEGCIYWQRKGSITNSEKKVDIPGRLKRLELIHSSSKIYSGQIKSESDLLIRSWVISVIKCAIRQRDKQSLVLVKEKFNYLLPPHWKLIRRIFQSSISLDIAQIILAILVLANKLKSRFF
jgi:glycosyltransferase involved in cell wall biosynthesis